MKIAVTYDNGVIFQHFGRTEHFKVYEIVDNKVVSTGVIDANGTGHGALAGLLADNNVDMLICGGIGGGAQIALMEANVRLFAGISGYADDAIEAYLAGKLAHNPNANCSHHDHEHGESDHACGSHGCGSHGCGSHDCH